MQDFDGFPPETFRFLADLEANNDRDWFTGNRAKYDAHVVAPTLAFIAAMAEPLSRLDPAYDAQPKLNGSFRRLNRDVRFSKDKSPYAPRIHMIFWAGDHPMRAPALHFVLHKDHLGYGAGQWQMTPDALESYRQRVQKDTDRAALEAAIAGAAEVGCARDTPPLKRPAGGVPADHPATEHLRHKALVVRTLTSLPLPGSVSSSRFVEDCVDISRALSPVNRWLLGPA